MESMDMVVKVALFFIPFLFALCFHEFAHGFVAKLRGDNTAEMMGRLTLNPLAHVDWVGTVALPIMAIIFNAPLFGWAKPVPVNSRNLKDPKNDMFWVALAGPLSNVFLFVVGLIVFFVCFHYAGVNRGTPLGQMLVMFLYINLFLAIFNMLPLHPLDGGKVISRFLPYSANRWLEDNQYQLNMVLLVLVILGGLRFMIYPAAFLIENSLAFIQGVQI